MTRLRKMMLEELQRRNYSEITTRKYLQYVTAFARHFGKSPDQLGPNELRSYQAYLLQERKVSPGTAVNCVAALRFFFIKTLKLHQFREFSPYPKDRRRLAGSGTPSSPTPGNHLLMLRIRIFIASSIKIRDRTSRQVPVERYEEDSCSFEKLVSELFVYREFK